MCVSALRLSPSMPARADVQSADVITCILSDADPRPEVRFLVLNATTAKLGNGICTIYIVVDAGNCPGKRFVLSS